MSFEVAEPVPKKYVDPTEIQKKSFVTSWKGYKVEEVRSFLASVAFDVRELLAQLETVQTRVAELESQGQADESAVEGEFLKSEERAAQILHEASEAARALRDQAEQIFLSTRARAEAEAQEIIENAKAQSRYIGAHSAGAQINAQIEEAAKKELEQARQRAAEIIEQSKAEGRAMIDQARDLRNEILADLREKRSALDGEIASLATRRIEAYQSLARAVELISEAGSIVSVEHEEGLDVALRDKSLAVAISDLGESGELSSADDGADPPKDENEDVKPSFYSPNTSPIALVSSGVEIGSHLEEGIVRVFYKENEISKYGFAIPTESATSSLIPKSGDLEGRGSQQVESQIQEVDQAGTLRLEPESSYQASSLISDVQAEAVASEEDVTEDLSGETSGLHGDVEPSEKESPSSENGDLRANSESHFHGKESLADSEELSFEVAAEGHSSVEPQEEMHSYSTQDEVEVVHQSGESSLRSRRADEILSRIRSLRIDEEDISKVDLAVQTPATYSMAESEFATLEKSGSGDSQVKRPRPQLFAQMKSEEPIDEAGFQVNVGKTSRSDDLDDEWLESPREVDEVTRELLEVREEQLAPIATMFVKKMKRLLADEQNDLLDKVRRNSGTKIVLEDLLGEKAQIDSLAIASLDFFEQVRLGVAELFSKTNGSTLRREISAHAVEYSEEFAKELIVPLRRRIDEILILDSSIEDQSTAAVLGAVYRDARSNRLETLISQYVNTVFCATIMRESGYEEFIWVLDPEDTPCADCLDNSLAGATLLGEPFPTGHLHPGIHSGCRCLLVPFIA